MGLRDRVDDERGADVVLSGLHHARHRENGRAETVRLTPPLSAAPVKSTPVATAVFGLCAVKRLRKIDDIALL